MNSKIGDGIVYVGLGLAYLKTSEAMVPYAPRAIFGWRSDWVGYLWAYLAGALVEGVLFVAYDKLKTHGKDSPTKWLSVIVALISVAFSITMNRIDQMVTDGQALLLASGDPLALLHNVVFLIPLFAALLFMAMNVVDNQVPDQGQRKGNGRHSGMEFGRGPDYAREHRLPRMEVAAEQADPTGLPHPPSLLSEPASNGRKYTSESGRMPHLSG